MKQRLAALALLFALPAAAQQPSVPDPRIEAALSTTVIKETQRSVQLDKAMPRIETRRPKVEEPYMAGVADGVYMDRRLMPSRGAAYDPNAVHIRPRDR